MTDLSKKDLGTDLGTIVVTGGSRGIGAAISLQAGRRRATSCWSITLAMPPRPMPWSSEIGAAGGRALAHRADMADEAAIAAMFSAADAIGPLAGLVANAGVIGDATRRFHEQDRDSLMPVVAINILAPMLCAAQAVRRLSTERGGKGGGIVLISSVAARTGGIPALSPIRPARARSRVLRAGWRARSRARGSASTRSRRA